MKASIFNRPTFPCTIFSHFLRGGIFQLVFPFFLCIACSFSLNAQANADSLKKNKVELKAFYFGGGFGFGKSGTPKGASINFILSNNWGAGFSYKYRVLLAANTPADYSPGWSYSSYGGSNSNSGYKKNLPKETYDVYSFMLFREGQASTPKVRYGIEAGPSWVKFTKPSFRSQPVVTSQGQGLFSGSSQSSNYAIDYSTYKTVGLSLRAKLEFPVGEFLGFEFAISGNINKFHSFAGVEAYLTFGMVRQAIPKQAQLNE